MVSSTGSGSLGVTQRVIMGLRIAFEAFFPPLSWVWAGVGPTSRRVQRGSKGQHGSLERVFAKVMK